MKTRSRKPMQLSKYQQIFCFVLVQPRKLTHKREKGSAKHTTSLMFLDHKRKKLTHKRNINDVLVRYVHSHTSSRLNKKIQKCFLDMMNTTKKRYLYK